MKVVPEDNWENYSYRTDDGPVFVSFHADADKTLDREEISKESLSHEADCERLGIEFDGWGCVSVS